MKTKLNGLSAFKSYLAGRNDGAAAEQELLENIKYWQQPEPPQDFKDAVNPNLPEAKLKALWGTFRTHVLSTADPYDFKLRVEHFETWPEKRYLDCDDTDSATP